MSVCLTNNNVDNNRGFLTITIYKNFLIKRDLKEYRSANGRNDEEGVAGEGEIMISWLQVG